MSEKEKKRGKQDAWQRTVQRSNEKQAHSLEARRIVIQKDVDDAVGKSPKGDEWSSGVNAGKRRPEAKMWQKTPQKIGRQDEPRRFPFHSTRETRHSIRGRRIIEQEPIANQQRQHKIFGDMLDNEAATMRRNAKAMQDMLQIATDKAAAEKRVVAMKDMVQTAVEEASTETKRLHDKTRRMILRQNCQETEEQTQRAKAAHSNPTPPKESKELRRSCGSLLRSRKSDLHSCQQHLPEWSVHSPSVTLFFDSDSDANLDLEQRVNRTGVGIASQRRLLCERSTSDLAIRKISRPESITRTCQMDPKPSRLLPRSIQSGPWLVQHLGSPLGQEIPLKASLELLNEPRRGQPVLLDVVLVTGSSNLYEIYHRQPHKQDSIISILKCSMAALFPDSRLFLVYRPPESSPIRHECLLAREVFISFLWLLKPCVANPRPKANYIRSVGSRCGPRIYWQIYRRSHTKHEV
jgi:hypothetical protein